MKTSTFTMKILDVNLNWTVLMVLLGLILIVNSSVYAASVVIQWDPNTESDLAGYKIYYKVDSSALPFNGVGAIEGSSPIDVHDITSATISGLDPNHSYSFAVTAYNTSGLESEYSDILSIAESAVPTINIISPSINSNVAGSVSVTASATDNVGVTKVEFYLNGSIVSTVTSAPYIYSWNTLTVTPGSYNISAKAYDAAGNVGQSGTVSVNVVNDISAPVVSFASPSNSGTVSGTVEVIANASDNINVSMVEFYENGLLVAAVNSAPYKYVWNTVNDTNGQAVLLAKAYDSNGNMGQATINVSVNNVSSTSESSDYTISDATLALQVAVGKVKPTNEQKSRLDVAPISGGKSNPNGKIDVGDAIVILSKVVGKPLI